MAKNLKPYWTTDLGLNDLYCITDCFLTQGEQSVLLQLVQYHIPVRDGCAQGGYCFAF